MAATTNTNEQRQELHAKSWQPKKTKDSLPRDPAGEMVLHRSNFQAKMPSSSGVQQACLQKITVAGLVDCRCFLREGGSGKIRGPSPQYLAISALESQGRARIYDRKGLERGLPLCSHREAIVLARCRPSRVIA